MLQTGGIRCVYETAPTPAIFIHYLPAAAVLPAFFFFRKERKGEQARVLNWLWKKKCFWNADESLTDFLNSMNDEKKKEKLSLSASNFSFKMLFAYFSSR